MSEYGHSAKPLKSDISYQEDFGYKYDLRANNTSWIGINKEKQERYDNSRERLISSPLIENHRSFLIDKFIDTCLCNSEDPFDSFCEVVSHWKGITKEKLIKMDTDERNKISKESIE